jgi:hypothetical protein
MSESTKRRAGRRVAILDKDAMARVARWYEQVRSGEAVRSPRTAKADESLARLLRRLKAGELDHVLEDTLAMFFAEAEQRRDYETLSLISRSVLSAYSRGLLKQYEWWAEERVLRFYDRGAFTFVETDDGGLLFVKGETEAQEARRAALRSGDTAPSAFPAGMGLQPVNPLTAMGWIRAQEMYAVAGYLYGTDDDQPGPCRAMLRDFLNWMAKQGHTDDWRVELSFQRIVEPLLERNESGLIERGVFELVERDVSELRKFVELGIEREKLLLEGRRPALQRAQQLVDGKHAPAPARQKKRRARTK